MIRMFYRLELISTIDGNRQIHIFGKNTCICNNKISLSLTSCNYFSTDILKLYLNMCDCLHIMQTTDSY